MSVSPCLAPTQQFLTPTIKRPGKESYWSKRRKRERLKRERQKGKAKDKSEGRKREMQVSSVPKMEMIPHGTLFSVLTRC